MTFSVIERPTGPTYIRDSARVAESRRHGKATTAARGVSARGAGRVALRTLVRSRRAARRHVHVYGRTRGRRGGRREGVFTAPRSRGAAPLEVLMMVAISSRTNQSTQPTRRSRVQSTAAEAAARRRCRGGRDQVIFSERCCDAMSGYTPGWAGAGVNPRSPVRFPHEP